MPTNGRQDVTRHLKGYSTGSYENLRSVYSLSSLVLSCNFCLSLIVGLISLNSMQRTPALAWSQIKQFHHLEAEFAYEAKTTVVLLSLYMSYVLSLPAYVQQRTSKSRPIRSSFVRLWICYCKFYLSSTCSGRLSVFSTIAK